MGARAAPKQAHIGLGAHAACSRIMLCFARVGAVRDSTTFGLQVFGKGTASVGG
jgi:hypothetical protein